MASLDDYRKQELMKRSGVEMYSQGPFAAAKQPKPPAAPAGPGLIQRAFPNTYAATKMAADDIGSAYKQGGLASAAGQAVRSSMMPSFGLMDDAASRAKSALDFPAQALKTAVTGDASPIGQSPLVSAAAKAPTPRPLASYSNEGRNAPAPSAMPSQTQAQAPSNPLVSQIAPGIYRQGNSYGDSPQAAAEFASNKPVSAQNMAAADQLAARYQSNPLVQAAQPPVNQNMTPADTGQGYGYGLLNSNRIAVRNAMVDAGQFKPGAGRALAALLQQQGDAPKLAMEREQMAQRGQESAADRLMRGQELNARLGESAADRALKSQELADNMKTNDVKRQAAGVELTGAQRLQALQGEFLNAETDAARDAAAKKLQGLSGKAPAADWGVQVTPGVKNIDGSTTEGSVYKFNKATGEVQRVDGQQQAQAAQAPKITADQAGKAAFDALPKGARYVGPDGRTYTKN